MKLALHPLPLAAALVLWTWLVFSGIWEPLTWQTAARFILAFCIGCIGAQWSYKRRQARRRRREYDRTLLLERAWRVAYEDRRRFPDCRDTRMACVFHEIYVFRLLLLDARVS
jgi:hypothetical protein